MPVADDRSASVARNLFGFSNSLQGACATTVRRLDVAHEGAHYLGVDPQGRDGPVTQNLFKPLSQSEIEELDRFLLERIDEGAVTEDSDEGVFCVSELDGLFTAVVSGPVMIPPSGWLPAVWGDFEPVWDDMAEFERIFGLMARHMNELTGLLTIRPDDFAPLFEERVVQGRRYTIVDEWCENYSGKKFKKCCLH
jgi:hypothetical protein